MLGNAAPVRTFVSMTGEAAAPVSGSTSAPRMFGMPLRSDDQTR